MIEELVDEFRPGFLNVTPRALDPPTSPAPSGMPDPPQVTKWVEEAVADRLRQPIPSRTPRSARNDAVFRAPWPPR